MDDAVKMLLCTAAVAVLWLYKNVNGFLFCIILIMVLLMFFYLQSTEQHNKPQHPTRQSERRTITDMKYNLDHPLVRVWLPDEDNKYGHVSLQTNKYYMSFWPQKSSRKKSDIEKLLGAPACIIFHPDFDCKEEGNRFPDHKLPVTIATCSDMDRLYERFLAYNGIDKEEVNLNKGCNIRNRDELANRRIEEDLDKTRYTFLPKLCYKNEEPFYRSGQSCVSFVYHMIEWSKYSDSKTVKIEFFGKLFKFLDKVTASFPLEPPKREVYTQVWMHTVDGRIVQGVERMMENQWTGELTHPNLYKRQVTTEPLTLSYETSTHVEQDNTTNLGFGSIWKVPDFIESLFCEPK